MFRPGGPVAPMRSLAAVLLAAILLTGCRDAPAVPPMETAPAVQPQPTGTPLTECRDGSWSTSTGAGACSHHGGVKR